MGTVLLTISQPKRSQSKFDAPLQFAINSAKKREPNAEFRVLVQCNSNISDKMKETLIESGLELRTVAGKICTTSGNIKVLERVEALEFVTHLSLAQPQHLFHSKKS